RYHGDSPLLCGLVHNGLVTARAYRQNETFAAAVQFAHTEGIIPAPEPPHAIKATIDEALAAREAGEHARPSSTGRWRRCRTRPP
ncbi:MAG TPA: hypothetical protein VFW09_07265, partial [Solirubrobacteraceae bacterium]|nr:hypothetical protein [Solirubrobacteraceae bacterium]